MGTTLSLRYFPRLSFLYDRETSHKQRWGHIFLESLQLISHEALNISVLTCKRRRKVGDEPEELDPNAALDRSWRWLLTQPAVVYQ